MKKTVAEIESEAELEKLNGWHTSKIAAYVLASVPELCDPVCLADAMGEGNADGFAAQVYCDMALHLMMCHGCVLFDPTLDEFKESDKYIDGTSYASVAHAVLRLHDKQATESSPPPTSARSPSSVNRQKKALQPPN